MMRIEGPFWMMGCEATLNQNEHPCGALGNRLDYSFRNAPRPSCRSAIICSASLLEKIRFGGSRGTRTCGFSAQIMSRSFTKSRYLLLTLEWALLKIGMLVFERPCVVSGAKARV